MLCNSFFNICILEEVAPYVFVSFLLKLDIFGQKWNHDPTVNFRYRYSIYLTLTYPTAVLNVQSLSYWYIQVNGIHITSGFRVERGRIRPANKDFSLSFH